MFASGFHRACNYGNTVVTVKRLSKLLVMDVALTLLCVKWLYVEGVCHFLDGIVIKLLFYIVKVRTISFFKRHRGVDVLYAEK